MREWTEPHRPLAGPPPANLTARGAVVCVLVSLTALTVALFLGPVGQCEQDRDQRTCEAR